MYFLLFFKCLSLRAQASLSLQNGIGYTIANHPRFPQVEGLSPTLAVQYWQPTQGRRLWSRLYGRPDWGLQLHWQDLGNAAILGQAWGLVPQLRWQLGTKKGTWVQHLRLGWGLGYLNKPFDTFGNPQNIVAGAAWNACALVAWQGEWRWHPKWALGMDLGLVHYSNGGLRNPNLGVNQMQWNLSLSYRLAPAKPLTNTSLSLPPLRKRWGPMTQLALGWSSKAIDGPLFPVYNAALGISWRTSHRNLWMIAWDYTWHEGVAAFQRHSGRVGGRIGRHALWLGHEWLFGYWGLSTGGGLYLHPHLEQRSWIATRLGINFYPKNVFKKPKHLWYLGLNIRAYLGEAEWVEFSTGYRW